MSDSQCTCLQCTLEKAHFYDCIVYFHLLNSKFFREIKLQISRILRMNECEILLSRFLQVFCETNFTKYFSSESNIIGVFCTTNISRKKKSVNGNTVAFILERNFHVFLQAIFFGVQLFIKSHLLLF